MSTYNNIKAELGDIIVMVGEKFDLSLEIYQKDDNGVETAYSVSGKTVTMEIRATKATAVVLTMLSPTDITISGTDNNVITFNKVLDTLSEGKYWYDIQVDEDDYTIRSGRLLVKAQITDN